MFGIRGRPDADAPIFGVPREHPAAAFAECSPWVGHRRAGSGARRAPRVCLEWRDSACFQAGLLRKDCTSRPEPTRASSTSPGMMKDPSSRVGRPEAEERSERHGGRLSNSACPRPGPIRSRRRPRANSGTRRLLLSKRDQLHRARELVMDGKSAARFASSIVGRGPSPGVDRATAGSVARAWTCASARFPASDARFVCCGLAEGTVRGRSVRHAGAGARAVRARRAAAVAAG